MITAFLTTLGEMARILLFVAVGFGLYRMNILPKNVGTGMSRLVTILFLPAMMFYTNTIEFEPANIVSYGALVCLGASLWAAVAVLSGLVSRKLSGGNMEDRSIYLYGLSFANTGAVGLPLMMAFFGTAGVFQMNLFTFVSALLTYAWGVGLFVDGGEKRSLRQVLARTCNPVSVAMVLGLILGALGAKNWLPSLVLDFAGGLADCYVPVSLLATGYTIAGYPLGEIFNRAKSYVFAAVRLIGIPAFVLIVAWILKLPQMVAIVAMLTFASPSGMNVVVYPAAYGRDCKTGASIVLISSLGSVLTIPLLYALTQYFFH